MKDPPKSAARCQARLRGLAGLAGMAVACVVLASVTVLFGQASSMPWLPDTPSNVAAMQRCGGVAATAARRACAEKVVAEVLARDPARRLAQRAQEQRMQGTAAPASLQ